MEMAIDGWRTFSRIAPFFIIEALLPGAARVLILLGLSHRFVRVGFGELRQHAHPFASAWTSNAGATRNWWSCTCVSCRCLVGFGRALRRCCFRLLDSPSALAV
jgi:hypothetical protein